MDLLAESITEVAVSGEIANTDRVLNIAYGIDRNFLFGAAAQRSRTPDARKRVFSIQLC